MIEKGENTMSNPGIHVVLESIPFSELYFHEYYLYLRENLYARKMLQKSSQDLSVTSMTSSNYHSLAMFLHASDLSEKKITE